MEDQQNNVADILDGDVSDETRRRKIGSRGNHQGGGEVNWYWLFWLAVPLALWMKRRDDKRNQKWAEEDRRLFQERMKRL